MNFYPAGYSPGLCTCCRLHPVDYQCPIDSKVGVCSGCACILSNKYGWTWERTNKDIVSGLLTDVHVNLPNIRDDSISGGAVRSIVGATNTLSQNIQTVAIVGLCVGALLFMYFIHEGAQSANRAFDFASAHPETVAKLQAAGYSGEYSKE